MSVEDFPAGSLVFAKVPGYSFWPAKVIDFIDESSSLTMSKSDSF